MPTDRNAREPTLQNEGSNSEADTDAFFGLVAGLYAATLVAPAVAIGVALWMTTDPGALFFVLLGTTVVVVIGVGWVARQKPVAIRLGGTRWVWLTVVPPFGYAALLVASADTEAVPGAVVGISLLAMVVGLMGGLGVLAAAHNRHAKAMLADAEELARFTARAPERDRRLVKWTVGGLVGVGVLSFAGAVVLDFEPLQWLFQFSIPLGAGLWGSTTDRTVVVSDAGLVVGNPAHKQFRPWSAFESYSVSDEAIVVRRARWSAWGLRDLRRDASEVEDLKEVESTFDTYLART